MAESVAVAVHIDRAPEEVYEFIVDPPNLASWAAGLGAGVRQVAGRWRARMGGDLIDVEFVPRNAFGIADHYVTFPDGRRFHNPLRVTAEGTGSRVTFTVNRDPDFDDAAFARDQAAVKRDLEKLKSVLER